MDNEEVNKLTTKELSILKAKAHNIYNQMRDLGLSHNLAIGAIVETTYWEIHHATAEGREIESKDERGNK